MYVVDRTDCIAPVLERHDASAALALQSRTLSQINLNTEPSIRHKPLNVAVKATDAFAANMHASRQRPTDYLQQDHGHNEGAKPGSQDAGLRSCATDRSKQSRPQGCLRPDVAVASDGRSVVRCLGADTDQVEGCTVAQSKQSCH